MSRSTSTLFVDLDVEVHPDFPLGPETWFGVGGRADILICPRSVEALGTLVRRCHENEIPLRVLGSGANLLVADDGVDGVVVRLNQPAFREVSYNASGAVEAMRAMAGADLARTLNETVRRGLSGLQQVAGIPASIGGALHMNAGGAFGSIGDGVHSVACLNERGEIVVYPASELSFEYRRTNLPAGVILWAAFNLQDDDPKRLRERVLEIFSYKKSTQPLADSSAGCTFKNPIDPATGERTSAGGLIDRAGLKGLRLGSAEVSTLHGNFLHIHPGGSASDLLRLIDQVRSRVASEFAIELSTEVAIWGRS
ncbi:MAG: UDP-N-acetylmuramate dehydrogenase [Phycisphaerales bacterium]|nr:UDP-N-acetylmuramate dehydrogenase [Phycisphaerales bacterium]